MKRYLLITYCLLSFLCLHAQNRLTDTSATCVAYWKNQEKKVYTVYHNKDKEVEGAPPERVSYAYEAHITVKDSTGEGYTMEWRNRNYSSYNEANAAQMNTLFKNLKFVYKTDNTGTFLELVNWEEVRDFYLNLARLSLPTNDTADAVWEKTKALFGTQAAVQNSLIKDVQLFHTFFGNEYGTRKMTAETLLPNVFGGDPIPALQTVQVTRLEKNSPTFTVRTTQEIDKGNATALIRDLMKHFGAAEPKTIKETEELLSNFTISDETEINLHVKSGWPAMLYFNRSAKVMTTLQTERYQFTSKPEPEAIKIDIYQEPKSK